MTEFAATFRTLGCKVNQVESESIALELLGMGATVVDEADAQIIIINTCSVTAEADHKARKAIRHALALPREPLVLVTGCGASLDAELLAALGDRVVVEADKALVAARALEQLGFADVAVAASPASAVAAAGTAASGSMVPLSRTGRGFRTRAMLKIEDGCDAFCAYCIVPYARGVPRAVPLAQLKESAQALVASGAKEIVLTGINIGRYRSRGAGLAQAIVTVASCGVARLRLSSIEPLDLTPDLLDAVSRTPAFCPHLHVPLQSGSDAVLSAMGRRYSTAEFEERIAAARVALPGLAVSTDVMCGFPGETDAQAAETLEFVERMGFAKLHVFRYSERPGTRAASMPGAVEPRVRAARASALREVGDRLRAEFIASREGARVEVVVESGRGARAVGTTGDYLRVEMPRYDAVAGSTVTVTLGSAGVEVIG